MKASTAELAVQTLVDHRASGVCAQASARESTQSSLSDAFDRLQVRHVLRRL
jgi:hypothetical protein